jgi:hypothetical protein
MDTQVAGYEVSSDDGRFKQVRPTIASAESLISSAQEGRQNTVEKLTGELEKTQATIESNREKLNELDQIGEQDSAGYKKIESNTKNLVSKVSRLNEKIQSVSQPLQIKAKQEKKSRKGFTLFEGGKPVGTYPTQEDAEIAAVAFRTDEELDGIINAAPKAQLESALEQPFGEQPVQVGTVRGGMPRRLYDEAVKEKDRRYRSQAGLPPPAAPVKIKITGDAQAAAERLRASGITVRFMPEVEKEIPEINKRLRAVLDKLGLKDIRLNIVNSLKAPGYVIYGRDGKPAAMFLKVPPGSPEYAKTMATIAQARAQGLRVEEDVFSANGSYAAKLIEIALDSKNPIRAARHEAIHALKELGFFTPQQWAVLERKAKSEWLKKYNIEGSGYGSLSKEGQIEEAIADAFSDFDQETPPTGQIGILFNKVKKFFEALGNAFRGSGFQTSSDVFTLVEEGRLTGPGATGVTGTEATRYSVAPLSKGEVDALSASGPNSALIIDAYNRWAQAFSKLPSDVKNKLDALYVANRKTKLTAQDPGYSDRGARAAETRTFKAASQALEKHLGKELNPDELSLYLTDWRGSVDERLEKPPSFERNKYSLSQIPRVMSTGKIVGAPPGKNTEADRELLINEMVQLLEDPFTMFNESRFWYENSGKTIREMTRSDPELMERVVRLLSLYSQANSLGGNTTATIKSISQLAQGAPTALAGRFPNETAKRIPAILSAPTMDSTLPGVDDKLMNFYRNLRDATFQDDTFSDASTVDRWMMRLFGYPHAEDQEIGGATGVSNTQYVYAKDLLKKIADIESERTGEAILPRQIQAALWTYVRNKTEFDSLPPEKQATFEPKNVDFADYVTRATVNITWESRPSTKINLIPGIHKASRRSQEEFNRAVREIFVDPTTGEDKIFKLLDNQQLYSSEFSIGAYENRVVPNVITRLVLQKDNGEYLTSVADNYAAIVGYVTKQDAVPWYRADPTATGKDASVGYRVTPSVASTIDFENKLFEHLNNKIPGIGFTRIGGSFDFVNFRDADTGKPFAMPDKKYIEKLQDALKTFASDVNFNVVPFRAKSGWISNNWEENADGQGYLDRLRKAGLGDLQRVIDGWSETYGEIANDFGKEFGWARLSLKSNESIGGPSIGSGISIRPQQPTAQSFDAVHYGKQRVETLFGSMYGTGIKGAEAQRVFNSDDPRVRQRAYFYIPFNNGRMPKPEAGLGQEVHVQRLNNLLGPGPEMQGLASASRTPDGQFDENAFESSVIDAGYDGYAVPNMGMAVVLGSDVPVVSRGTRQEVEAKPDKDKIQIGNRKYSLRQTNTKEFKDWFGDSKIVNGDSTPKVMYHGLAKDTTDFTRKTERGAPIFLTDDPTFAPRFAADSYASVARNPEPYLTKEQIDGGVKRAIAAIKKDYGKDSLGKEMIESLKTGNLKDATPEAREYIQKEFINLLPTGPHIMPLYVRAERSFDYDNPEHIERVINNLKDSNINTELLSYDLNKGDWETIESPRVQEAIKELGFDSFYVEEIGRKNLAVYEPNQVKSAIGNLGTFSRTNNDIRYSLALEGLKPSSALIPDEGGNPSGNLGFMPEKLGGKPIRLLVGTHNDLVDELVNEKMYRPVSYGGNHILNRIMSYPRREPIGAEELLEKIARAAQKTSQTYTRIYKDGKRFILFDGKNSLILGENPDSMSIITMYTQTDPNRRYGNPAWFGRAPVVPEFVGAIRGTKVEAKEGRIAPSEVDTKAKRVYTPSEVGAIAAGEPQKGTITLKKLPKEKFSLALPKEVSKEFFDGSKYLPESTSVEQIRDDWTYRFNKEIYDPLGNPTGRTGMTQAYVLSDVVGGPEYIEALQDYVRENLGESFKGYRLMSIDEFEELETGSIGSQLVSYTLDPDFALLFANVARKRKFEKGERVVVEFDITPEHVQMIGSPGESELVIDYGIGYDPSKINAYASPVKFSLAGQKPVEPEFKMPPFARLRPETSEDIDKIYDYLEERAKKSGYKIETGSSNISGSRYLTIVEELPDDDVRSIELRVSNHGDRYSHTYADEKISIDPSRGGVDLEDALYQLQEKGYNLIEPQAIAPKGEPTKEPTKGTISLGKKLSLRVPDTAAVKKFLQGSPFSFDFETGDPLVFFRGQRRDAGPESFDIKTRATPSFTTNPHVASVYASRGLDTLPGEVESDWVYTDGSFLMPSFIQMKAAIDLRGYGNRPAILIDLFNDSGVDPAVFEDAPQELMDVLDELAQLQYSTGFQSGGAFESVEDALDAFRKDISKIDPDSLESRTEDAQEIIGNTVYGVLENLRIDPFAFADSQKVLDLVKQYYPKADAFIVRDVMSETFAEKLAEKGQIDDDSGYDTYKPFEVNQVKSIFNFNPDIKKKDVRYSLAGRKSIDTESENFKRFFSGSVVRNPDGSPMVVYHGTQADIAAFSTDAERVNRGENPDGFYFTSDPEEASYYAEKPYANVPNREFIRVAENANVMPVYLALTNPFNHGGTNSKFPETPVTQNMLKQFEKELRKENPDLDSSWYQEKLNRFKNNEVIPGGSISNTAKTRVIKAGGFDGMVDGRHFVVFEPTQIKSAITNTGAFDPTDPRIRYSLQSFGLAPTDAKDNAIFLLQDKNIDLKRIIEGIRKNGKILSEDYDAYRKEELFHGRSATLIKFFLDRELRPLLQKMQNANISLEQMDDYLLARHAKEANAYIRKVNPDKSQNSGMTDKEADDFMKALPTSRRNALDSISKDIDAITKKTREIMVDTGLESQNTVNQWEKTYKNYVPLFREEIEDGRPISLGRGFDIRGSTTRQRMGSSRKVVDVLANIAMQRERTIVRGEKNRIGKSLYGLILDNPHKGFWGVINPEKMSKQAMRTELSNLGIDPNAVNDLVDRPPKKVINKSTGLVSYEVPQAWKSAPNIFATRINGEDRFMIFNKQDERAMRMVATLKSLDAQQQGEAIKMMGTAGDYYRKSIGGIGTVTRYFAQINTQYNPAFGIYNLMRDIGGAVLNLQTTPLKGQEAKVVSDALIALKAVYQDLRRQRQGLGANSKWASIFEEFESEGGKTGYRDLFETSESRAESLQQELKDFGQGKIRGSGKAVMGWLSDFNDAIENSVRVSVYYNAKQKNLSNAAAASLAKNITVNFNRSGAVSRNFQTLFAFFNASIQGTARIAQTLLTSEGKLSPTGKKIVMGGITLGIIQAALLAMAGLDEDEVPDFVKDKSFVIPYGDGKYFAVPMPLGYNVIPSFGRRVMEFAMSEEKNVGKAVFDTSSMIIDGFNPLGSATFVQTLTPTILDPIVALAENKDFTGKPIFRDDINSLSPTPGYTRGSQNSFAITEALAYGINILTGGSEFKKGALSPTPDQIEYLVGEAFGGVGREALKVGRGIESLATGEELATYNVPIVGRLTGNVQQQAAQRSKFFNNIRRLNEHQAEIEGRLLQGDDISDYIDQYPEASLYQAGDKIYNQITKLRRTKKVLEESGAGKDDLKSIDETILSLMSSLNEIYDSARQQ